MAVPSRARSDFGSHLRRTAPAPSEPDCIDEPKKRWRVFLDGSSILGRLPGFFLPKKLRPARGAAESPFQQFLAFIPSLSRRVMGLLQFPVFSKLIPVFPPVGA